MTLSYKVIMRPDSGTLVPCINLPCVKYLVTSPTIFPASLAWLGGLSDAFRVSANNNIWSYTRFSVSLDPLFSNRFSFVMISASLHDPRYSLNPLTFHTIPIPVKLAQPPPQKSDCKNDCQTQYWIISCSYFPPYTFSHMMHSPQYSKYFRTW